MLWGRDDTYTIANDIIEIVRMCHSKGVNDVFVSEITCRPKFINEINEVNSILHDHSSAYNFNMISNSNINAAHLWTDNVHLNDQGTNILTTNYTNAINGMPY